MTAPDANRPEIERVPAVRWLSPSELVSAALRVGLSAVFGEYADKRELEELMAPSRHDGKFSQRDEVWLDYVADIGDGFDATYQVAHNLARPSLDFRTDEGQNQRLPRGEILFLGGDQVYPTASAGEYERRTLAPYRAALPWTDEHHPQIFAIPGNHDWYDGLTAFIRIFCDGSWLGGWQLPQSRSYFAVQVTPKWWVWGVDIQFDGYIDTPQLKFFRSVGLRMKAGDGIVFLSAKPSWSRTNRADTSRPTASMRNLDYLTRECVPSGVSIRLNLAGDYHHYARYQQSTTGAQFVTAGGGGAYLSATHHLDEAVTLRAIADADDRRLERQSLYPDRAWSKARRFAGPVVGFRNPSFAGVVGAFYLILAWLTLGSVRTDASGFTEKLTELNEAGVGDALESVAGAMFTSSGGIAVIIATSALLMKVSQASSWPKAILAGGLHGLAHIGGVLLTLLAVLQVVPDAASWIIWLGFVISVVILGSFIGSVIFGTYLGVADVFGLNSNELFAGLRIRHKKNFVRMRFTPDHIECHVVTFDKVPVERWWKPAKDPARGDPDFTLDVPPARKVDDYRPRILETFIVERTPTSSPR